MSTLALSTVILHAEPSPGDQAQWVVFSDENRGEVLHMPREKWEDFGRPEAITVDMRPGDLLNTDEETDGADPQ